MISVLFVTFFLSVISTESYIKGVPETFGPSIEDNYLVVVYFHHNDTKLASILNSFKEKLSTESFILMEVDCTQQKVICASEKVYSPQVIMYKDFIAKRFNGFTSELVNEVRNSVKGIVTLPDEVLKTKILRKDVLVAFYGPSLPDKIVSVSKNVSSIDFFYVNSPASRLLISNGNFPVINLNMDDSTEKLSSLIRSKSIRAVSRLSSSVLEDNQNERDILVYANEVISQSDIEMLEKIALRYQDIIVSYLTTKDTKALEIIPFKTFPSVTILSMKSKEATVFSQANSLEDVEKYVEKYKKGEIGMFRKNENPLNESAQKILRRINAEQFDEYKVTYLDSVILLCDTTSEECLEAIKDFETAANMLSAEKYLDIAFVDVAHNTIETCSEAYPVMVMYTGFDGKRICFEDRRPITPQSVINLVRERGKFPTKIGSFVPEKEMKSDAVALNNKKKNLEERKKFEASKEFAEKIKVWKGVSNIKSGLMDAKNEMRKARDVFTEDTAFNQAHNHQSKS
ncbi:hypothetical protein EIN_369400 [Entamoeba invadens IP1]|uniref:Thioredoxin domain-containing protein n=1 Tax=Entamoeba invadens IP1 TaxID=370355 RepID=A0A0A1UBT1_ENTIV|nr:hypothetical protein EIN_369400 [Entamoeba invadens IP1]ELP92618.1 hypothetical protein EIN_369400 [Entamoeba invadens IP1]|eukprot:XP_004259389.1 hypothetical protein EIN_369400 [Entamoeba invadens IP1]